MSGSATLTLVVQLGLEDPFPKWLTEAWQCDPDRLPAGSSVADGRVTLWLLSTRTSPRGCLGFLTAWPLASENKYSKKAR